MGSWKKKRDLVTRSIFRFFHRSQFFGRWWVRKLFHEKKIRKTSYQITHLLIQLLINLIAFSIIFQLNPNSHYTCYPYLRANNSMGFPDRKFSANPSIPSSVQDNLFRPFCRALQLTFITTSSISGIAIIGTIIINIIFRIFPPQQPPWSMIPHGNIGPKYLGLGFSC